MSTSVSSVVSHFPSAENGFTTTTSGSVSSGATTVGLNSVAGYTNGEIVVFVIDPSNASKQTFTGVMDTAGVQVTSVVWTAGSNTTHLSGATVVDYATATHISMMTKGLLVAHAQDGKLAATGGSLTSPKIITALNDTNDNELLKVTATTSAVNELTLANAATGGRPVLSGTGGDTNISPHMAGKGSGKAHVDGFMEIAFDFVASGGVWTGDAYASTRNASMTAMVCYINGLPITIAAVTARSFTASKDTYIDVLDNADGTGTLVYTEVTNNAASPALAANSIRIGIIITGASNIANVGSINQGQETKLLPIASSIPYAVTDSLGNLICPRDPNRRVLGYRIPTGSQSTSSGSKVDLTSVNFVINIPTGRKVKLTASFPSVYNNTSSGGGEINIYDVTSSVQLANSAYVGRGANDLSTLVPSLVYTPPASGVRNFKCQFNAVTTGTFNTNITSTQPSYFIAELV